MIMRKNKKSWSLILGICLFAAWIPLGKSQADERVRLENLAVSLVVDVSGSMGLTDPNSLRETAAKVFIDLLSPEDSIGVITFDENVTEAVPFQQVESTENKNSMKAALAGTLAPKGNTDYVKALESALSQLETFEGDARKIVLFVTDGIPDPDPARAAEEGFMETYMSSLWAETGRAAEEDIPIYTVGFGEIDPAILERMSLETLGASTVTEDPGTLAEVFFDIVQSLKNRSPMLQENFSLAGEKVLSFDMDAYISQTTMLFTQDSDDYEVVLEGPQGQGAGEGVAFYKERGYTLLTLNQKEKELVGTWKITLKPSPGAAAPNISAYGSMDFFFKLWLEEPLLNAVHPMNEPLKIRVYTNTPIPDTAALEAVITKNGVRSRTPIALKSIEGEYMGSYEDTKDHGVYEVEILLRENGQTVATANGAFTVRNVPVITSDYFDSAGKTVTGSTRIFRSSIQSGGVTLLPNGILTMEEYSFLVTRSDGTVESYPMKDDGEEASGDIKAGDGLYSAKVPFLTEGEATLSITYRGTYKGEVFVQTRELGKMSTGELKGISVTTENSEIIMRKGDQADLLVKVKNESIFPETLTFSVSEGGGTLVNPVHQIAPQEEKTLVLKYQPDGNSGKDPYKLLMTASSATEGRTISPKDLEFQVEVQSVFGRILSSLTAGKSVLLSLLLVFLLLSVLMVAGGLLLYRILVAPLYLVQGTLRYKKEWIEMDFDGILEMTPLKKKVVSIVFGQGQEEGDLHIPTKTCQYSLMLSKQPEDASWTFWEGWKGLFGKADSPRLRVQVTQPGILNFDGAILTKRRLYDGNVFETGDYVFRYEEEGEKSTKKAKNLLKERES
jgi:uncharacterized protein YegL